jgi:hypothetical protein
MKKLSLILCSVFLASSLYATENKTIKVNTNLVDKKIIKVVNQSVEKFLAYEGDLIGGGLDGEIYSPMIKEITKKKGKVTKLKIESLAFYISYDYDFGDPVDEEETTCTTTLLKSKGKYDLKNAITTCDFVPSENDHYTGHPCCEPDGPVIDANWCFDYLEEGLEFCSNIGGWDEY